MITPGLQTSEGKKSLGILVAGAIGIYYILSTRYQELPTVDQLLANAESTTEFVKTLKASSQDGDVANKALDTGTIMAILFGMYKTFSKYTDQRANLKSKDMEVKSLTLKQANSIIDAYENGTLKEKLETLK